VCWLQLRDDARPRTADKLAIGVALSVALVTRHEAFLVTAVLFVLDRVIRRRWGFLRDAVPLGAGGLPITLAWLAYNRAITGDPFKTTMLWADPAMQTFGYRSFDYQAANTALLVAEFCAFASVALLIVYAAALWLRVRGRAVRFYDLLFPATVVFFLLYPHDPGHQYGPRYWYFAWPSLALTVGAAFPGKDGVARVLGFRVHLPTLALLQGATYLAFTLAFALFLRLYVDARRAVYATPPPTTPAIILIPDRDLTLWAGQIVPFKAWSRDFTRNPFTFDAPVLYGRGDEPRFAAVACTLPGRAVYAWRGPGEMEKVACP
jgi:hypothetical protein